MKGKDWYWFYLNQVVGSNAPVFLQIIARYKDAETVYQYAKERNKEALKPMGEVLANRLAELADEALIDARLEWLSKRKISIIPLYCEDYPVLLKEIKYPPSLLYVKGKLKPDTELPIAVIGTRRCTDYGEAMAKHFAHELVRHGATVISGMARGLDAVAAWGALSVKEAENPTVAVLGSGIDVIYPTENARLYDIIAERGAVISEFLPGTRPLRDNFPYRNRVISGLSRGVLVIEAGIRSGTTITVNHAIDQDRDVFAMPGRITDALSFGPNRMIQRNEAKPVFCAADILIEYGVDIDEEAEFDELAKLNGKLEHEEAAHEKRDDMKEKEAGTKKKQKAKYGETAEFPQSLKKEEMEKAETSEPIDMSALTLTEALIVEQLQSGEKNADELCDLLSIEVSELNSVLTSLQFSGIIKQLPGRTFGL